MHAEQYVGWLAGSTVQLTLTRTHLLYNNTHVISYPVFGTHFTRRARPALSPIYLTPSLTAVEAVQWVPTLFSDIFRTTHFYAGFTTGGDSVPGTQSFGAIKPV